MTLFGKIKNQPLLLAFVATAMFAGSEYILKTVSKLYGPVPVYVLRTLLLYVLALVFLVPFSTLLRRKTLFYINSIHPLFWLKAFVSSICLATLILAFFFNKNQTYAYVPFSFHVLWAAFFGWVFLEKTVILNRKTVFCIAAMITSFTLYSYFSYFEEESHRSSDGSVGLAIIFGLIAGLTYAISEVSNILIKRELGNSVAPNTYYTAYISVIFMPCVLLSFWALDYSGAMKKKLIDLGQLQALFAAITNGDITIIGEMGLASVFGIVGILSIVRAFEVADTDRTGRKFIGVLIMDLLVVAFAALIEWIRRDITTAELFSGSGACLLVLTVSAIFFAVLNR